MAPPEALDIANCGAPDRDPGGRRAVGLGLTLARVGRERERRARAVERRPRASACAPGGRCRAGSGGWPSSSSSWRSNSSRRATAPEPADEAIHETRKALKRLRTIVRMLEPGLGERALAQETAALRDVAAQLSAARDAEVMLATLESLARASPAQARPREGVRRLRGRLIEERERARGADARRPGAGWRW